MAPEGAAPAVGGLAAMGGDEAGGGGGTVFVVGAFRAARERAVSAQMLERGLAGNPVAVVPFNREASQLARH